MRNIILTGPKHSGKTIAGKALELLYTCAFFDLDHLIQQNTGKTPRQLYTEDPAIFQKAEAGTFKALIENPDPADTPDLFLRFIAAGGGFIDNSEAVTALKNAGITTVYLNISADLAWQRIDLSAQCSKLGLPPFLQTENPQETHRILHERRAAAYRELADFIIEAEGKTPEQIAKEIYTYTV